MVDFLPVIHYLYINNMSAKQMIKDNWVNTVITWFLATFTSVIILSYTIKREDNKDIQEELNKKADKEYVKESIRLHEEKEKEIFEPIKKDLSDIKNFLFYNKRPNENKK